MAVKCIHGSGGEDAEGRDEALKLLRDEVNVVGKLSEEKKKGKKGAHFLFSRRHPNVMSLLGVCAAKLSPGSPFSCENERMERTKSVLTFHFQC